MDTGEENGCENRQRGGYLTAEISRGPGVPGGVVGGAHPIHRAIAIRDAREAAGLSQKELAARVGTSQSVISRLEDANYSGHSLTMMQRIAEALGQRVEIRFVADEAAGAKA